MRRLRRSGRGRLSLLATLGSAGLLLFAASEGLAQDQSRSHQVTWGHASPGDVSRFVVLISPVSGSIDEARQIDVGVPTSQSAGTMQIFSAEVSFTKSEFLAVAAVGHDGRMSDPSVWAAMPPTRPGQPTLVEN